MLHNMDGQLIIEAILDNSKSAIICVDDSTKLSSVACDCVKVQWLESKESTSVHQPINFINSGNVAHMKPQQTHGKADGAKRPMSGRNQSRP